MDALPRNLGGTPNTNIGCRTGLHAVVLQHDGDVTSFFGEINARSVVLGDSCFFDICGDFASDLFDLFGKF